MVKNPVKPPTTAKESKAVSQLKTTGDLTAKVEQLKAGRAPLEVQWRLNLAFWKGRQYTYFNRSLRKIQELPTADGDKPRWRVRIVSNQIVKGGQKLLALLTKTKPMFGATPSSSDLSAIKAAQTAEALAEHWWRYLHLSEKYMEALRWVITAGQGYWFLTWDKHAGTTTTYTVDPQGNALTNDGQIKAFQAQLQQMGMDPSQFQRQFYPGEISVEVLSPFNVVIDPSAKTFSEAKYVIIERNMDPDEVYARWKVRLEADSIPTPEDLALPMSGTKAEDRITTKVFMGFFLPTPVLPQGRYVVWSKQKPEPLEDGPYDFPCDCLPVVKFHGIGIAGQLYDMSVVESAIPIQTELNRTLSQIIEWKNMSLRPGMIAPFGALRQRLTNEPGQVLEYSGPTAPQWQSVPSLPPYVFTHLADIGTRLKECFFLTDVIEGGVPPNVEAGITVDLLQETATDAIAPLIISNEESLSMALQIMLGLAQRFYIEPRMMEIVGENGAPSVKQFMMSDVDNGVKIYCETGSSLPRTRAGRQARILELVDKGVMPLDQAYKYLDMGDLKTLAMRFRSAADQAAREHDKLLEGGTINPESMQQALTQLQSTPPDPATGQPVNPQTGQPFQGPGDLQKFIHQASLQPFPSEDLQVHLTEHALQMSSFDYETWPPQARQDLQDHWMATVTFFRSLPQMPQPQAVRSTLQLKGTVDPTTASQILFRGGVLNADPNALASPPLETWVTDDASKDQGFAAGNNPQSMEALQQHEQHLAQMAQAEQQMNQADDQSSMKAAHGLQKLSHAEQLHQAKLQKLMETQNQKNVHGS